MGGEASREKRSGAAWRSRASRSAATWAIVFRIVVSKSEKSIGFVRKSKAPRFIAVRMLGMSP
jgi:hypothetical protein